MGGGGGFWPERVSSPLSVSIALLCSFLLGLGDSCFNTQLYSILGRVYAEESMPAFAIFKFIQVSGDYEAPPIFPPKQDCRLPPEGANDTSLSM